MAFKCHACNPEMNFFYRKPAVPRSVKRAFMCKKR